MRTHRRTFVLGLSAAALAACSPPAERPDAAPSDAAPASATDPSAVIRPLYDRYLAGDAAGVFPPLEAQAPWSQRMRNELMAMMSRSEAREEPILDFDPFVNAQDWEIQSVNVSTDAVAEGSHAVVRANITNAGFAEDILYDLVWENGAWRIDNIRNADWDLRAIVTQP